MNGQYTVKPVSEVYHSSFLSNFYKIMYHICKCIHDILEVRIKRIVIKRECVFVCVVHCGYSVIMNTIRTIAMKVGKIFLNYI